MEILSSVLGREIQAVLSDPTQTPLYIWDARIFVGENIFAPMKILNIDFEENPEQKYATNLVVRMVLPAGDYYKDILPNDKELEISLMRYPINGLAQIDYGAPFTEERFKATIFDKQDISKATSALDAVSRELLNVTNIVEIQFQLLNKAIEQLRLIQVGGVFRKSTVTDFLKTMLTHSFSELEIEDARIPIGVDMVEASNTAIEEAIVIPHGTFLMDLPDYVQNVGQGVYSTGLGHFIKGEYWYIYPKYDTKRFGNTARTLNIIKVPANKLPFVEKSYRASGDTITILATGESSKYDSSEGSQANEGSGARFAKADNFLENFVKVEDNRATVSRGANVTEFLGETRPKDTANAFVSNPRITSNDYAQFSDVVRRQGNIFTFVWENSDMDLILPAMMVKISFLISEDVEVMQGVLLSAHHSIMLVGRGAFSNTYMTRSVLTIFIDPNANP